MMSAVREFGNTAKGLQLMKFGRDSSEVRPRPRLEPMLDFAVVGIAMLVLFRPNVTQWWSARRQQAVAARAVSGAWPEIIGGGNIISQGQSDSIIIEFADYQCPFCRANYSSLTTLLEKHPGITLQFRQLPLTSIHEHAMDAARSSVCAERGGSFSRMHAYLFENDDWISAPDPDWAIFAAGAGIRDTAAFIACTQSQTTATRIQTDADLAAKLGLNATPAFVGPSGIHIGMLDEQTLQRISAPR